MLEQKGTNENKEVIGESNNTNNKSAIKDEELIELDDSKALTPTFGDTFKASLIDLIVIGVASTVIVFVVDALLKLSGYAITQKFQMTFVIFMVVMVLYMSIMESGKMSATVGKKTSGLFITKR